MAPCYPVPTCYWESSSPSSRHRAELKPGYRQARWKRIALESSLYGNPLVYYDEKNPLKTVCGSQKDAVEI
jgi:hypothetical protein|tara:strand:- start:1104 stop:1316 length:213 start_codon:yes stop_codon:yes gene_type:complete